MSLFLLRWPPAFIIAYAEHGSILRASKSIDTSLNAFVSTQQNVILSKTGYYDYISNQNLSFLAPTSLSANNQTMVFVIHFKAETNVNAIAGTVNKLLKFANDQSYPGIKVGCTGINALFNELAVGSTIAFELIDAVVLPVSLIILGFNLRSYRHILVAIANLGCTLLLALAILVPIAKAVYINPFAPSILLTLGIAVCFDYSLFLLSRFREEIVVNRRSKEEAVFICLVGSGHVIMLSGTTLLLTFLLLIAFPQNFLQSVGYGCSTVIFTAVLSNISVGPCLLLSFDTLSNFDMCPDFTSCCGCFLKGSKNVSKLDKCAVTDERGNDDDVVIENRCSNDISDTIENSNDNNNTTTVDSIEKEDLKEKNPPLCPRLYWFRIAYFTTRRPYTTLLIAMAITIPFSMQFAQMVG